VRDDRCVDLASSTISGMTASSSLSCLFIQCIHTSSSLKLQQPPNNEHKLYCIHTKNLTPTSNTPIVFSRSRNHPHQWPQPSFLCLRYIDLRADEPKACKAETRTAFAYIQYLQGRPPTPKSVQTASCFSSSGIRKVSASCADRGQLRVCGGTQCTNCQACCCSCFRKSGLRVSLARVDHEYDDVLWFE